MKAIKMSLVALAVLLPAGIALAGEGHGQKMHQYPMLSNCPEAAMVKKYPMLSKDGMLAHAKMYPMLSKDGERTDIHMYPMLSR